MAGTYDQNASEELSEEPGRPGHGALAGRAAHRHLRQESGRLIVGMGRGAIAPVHPSDGE